MTFYRVVVTPDGGDPYDLPILYRDVLRWEQAHPGSTAVGFQAAPNARDMYRLAHLAARRQQTFGGTLDEFEATCEVAPGYLTRPEGSGEDGDPTHGAVSSGR